MTEDPELDNNFTGQQCEANVSLNFYVFYITKLKSNVNSHFLKRCLSLGYLVYHVSSWKGQFAQPLSQSGKKNIEKTEKCHRRSRLCAVMMMSMSAYLWIVFTHHLDDDITELAVL